MTRDRQVRTTRGGGCRGGHPADVALRAGTSPALVSYVLNGGPRSVAPGTRDRILAAVAELGYRPNTVARSLRMARGHSLGLVVPDSANPYFALLARAIEESAFGYGYPLLVGNAADADEREIGYLHAFVDRQVEGLLVVPTSESPRLVAEYLALPTPLVVVDRWLESHALASVTSDAVAGSLEAVSHLVEHGHRHIACLAGPAVSTSDERLAGWQTALAVAGLAPGPVLHRPFGGREGYDALPRLLAGPRRPTAVFVASDLAAMGLLRAAFDLGLRVPDDLAVVSFDGVEAAAYTRPGLSTVTQPVAEMGRLAIDLLIDALGTGPVPPGRRSLATRLVRRGSCGCSDGFLAGSAPGEDD